MSCRLKKSTPKLLFYFLWNVVISKLTKTLRTQLKINFFFEFLLCKYFDHGQGGLAHIDCTQFGILQTLSIHFYTIQYFNFKAYYML